MARVIFDVPDEFLNYVDETVVRWGFKSRAEFFRFAAMDFIHNDARYMPSDKILKVHTKAIRSVKARQNLQFL